MTLTLLLDLDDTLVVNPMERFVPAYLQAISSHLGQSADPALIVKALLAGTDRMIRNRNPEATLKEVFDGVFFPALDGNPDSIQADIDQFYARHYPSLKPLVTPVPGAQQLVKEAFNRGWRVVIATNPLFPLSAIQQRLDWAGISPAKYPFDLIPSYESFHFTKPDPAYLAELLARLGWPEGRVLMVGDDPHNDLRAANGLGLATYWVPRPGAGQPYEGAAPTATGTLEELITWIDALPAEILQPDYTSQTAILAVLRSTPAALDALCNNLPDNRWTQRPSANEWCQTEIICHLRDVENDVHQMRLEKVLGSENPFIPGHDTDPWAVERQYILQDGNQALHQFSNARRQTLEILDGLAPEDWQRPARHAILGPTTLQELVRIMADHDRLHIQQAYATIRPESE